MRSKHGFASGRVGDDAEELAALLLGVGVEVVALDDGLGVAGFSGIRMAELARLDWNAVDLERRHIGVRAGQVALEAGNSPSSIFKHYRELTTENQADEWFAILPKVGQWENSFTYDRTTRTVTLPKSTDE